jgi:NAD-dependent deacetylase
MVADGRRNERLVILTGAGISADSGVATFRAADGCGKGTGSRMSRRPKPSAAIRAGARLLRCAPRQARDGRAQRRAPRAGQARAEWPGELPARHPERRRPARARRLEAPAPHAWRAEAGWCLACDERFPWDGPMGEGAAAPPARPSGRSAPTSSGSARCPTRWSASTKRCNAATCSSRSARPARSIPPPASSRPRAIAAPAARDQPRAEPGQHLLPRDAGSGVRPGDRAATWVDELLG